MAEANLIKKADLAKAREIEFTYNFSEGVRKLMEALGVTRKIAKQAGKTIKDMKASISEERMSYIKNDILFNKLVNFLLENNA